MREKQLKQRPPTMTSKRDLIKVPPEYWDDLKKMDSEDLCGRSLAIPHLPEGFLIRFLKDDVLIDMENRCFWRLSPDQREKIEHPLLELVILVYLLNVAPDLISRK